MKTGRKMEKSGKKMKRKINRIIKGINTKKPGKKKRFIREKEKQLSKQDLSRKGSIDEGVLDVVRMLNASHDYYTTSSCAGRITLTLVPESGKKCDAEWAYKTHELADVNEMIECANEYEGNTSKCADMSAANSANGELWFKFEPAILHVACINIESASKLLEAARIAGFKHSGIMSAGKSSASDSRVSDSRIIAQIIGTDKIEAPISFCGARIASDEYMKALTALANKKMKRNKSKLERLKQSIHELCIE